MNKNMRMEIQDTVETLKCKVITIKDMAEHERDMVNLNALTPDDSQIKLADDLESAVDHMKDAIDYLETYT